MCSTGLKGKINVSTAAYEKVKASDLFFSEHQVEAKGKGKLTTFVIEKNKPLKNKLAGKLTSLLNRM